MGWVVESFFGEGIWTKGKLTFLPNQKQKAGILRVQGADRGHMDSRYNQSSRRRTIQHLQMQITSFFFFAVYNSLTLRRAGTKIKSKVENGVNAHD